MYSTITFEGNLADDVTIKENQAGGVYLDAVILVNRGKDRDGHDRPATRWQVRISGRTAENAANLRKGTRLLIVGSVVTDSCHDRDTGDKRYAQRVIAQAVGVALTFTRVTGLERTAGESQEPAGEGQ